MIHPTAIIHPSAKIHPTVRVGPYAVIDGAVELGAECVVGPHAYLTGGTKIGSGNKFFAGAVIGEAPQDLKYKDEPTRVVIGDNNVFREHVTVHRGAKNNGQTTIGSNNFLMANAHVAHDCQIGNHVILANGALLGGHVMVQDSAFVSGNCVVHQFVRIGTLAMMQGGSAASQDLPPFTIGHSLNVLCGLNVVGLRRAGIGADERLELKSLYKLLFRSGQGLRAAVVEARERFSTPSARILIEFVATTKRGVYTGRNRGVAKTEEE